MKNIQFIIIFLIGSHAFSQYNQGYGGGMNNGMGMNHQYDQQQSQPKKIDPPTNDEIIKKMTDALQLDQLQQLQIRELLMSTPKQIEPKDKAEYDELVAQREKTIAKLKKILTEDQFTKWESLKGKMPENKKSESRKERKEREKKEAEAALKDGQK